MNPATPPQDSVLAPLEPEQFLLEETSDLLPAMTRGCWFEKAIDSIVAPTEAPFVPRPQLPLAPHTLASLSPPSPPPPRRLHSTNRNASATRKTRRARRRPPGWTPMPRAERVYKTCAKCGKKNHVRRLCCNGCYATKSEMGSGVDERSAARRSAASASDNSENASSSLPFAGIPTALAYGADSHALRALLLQDDIPQVGGSGMLPWLLGLCHLLFALLFILSDKSMHRALCKFRLLSLLLTIELHLWKD